MSLPLTKIHMTNSSTDACGLVHVSHALSRIDCGSLTLHPRRQQNHLPHPIQVCYSPSNIGPPFSHWPSPHSRARACQGLVFHYCCFHFWCDFIPFSGEEINWPCTLTASGLCCTTCCIIYFSPRKAIDMPHRATIPGLLFNTLQGTKESLWG